MDGKPIEKWRRGIITVIATGLLSACGEEKNPETHERWDVGDCVTFDEGPPDIGVGDLDDADCDATDARRIVEINGPFGKASCPSGTDRVRENQVGPGIIQELVVCLEDV